GATQVYAQFTGFMRDENTMYNDHTFVLPILKQSTPTDRGVETFFGPAILYITGMQNVPVSLQWSGFEIASINLLCDATPAPVPPTYTAGYPDTSPLIYDNTVITLPDVTPATLVIFTIQGLDGNGNVLNTRQYDVSIEQQPDIYTFAGPEADVSFNLDQDATVTLNWNIYSVASIALSSASSVTYKKNYPPSPLWNKDSTVISISGLTAGTSIAFTLDGYDAQGNLINSLQCTVDFSLTGWCDPKDQKVYPIVVINNQTWLAQNYDYNDPTGSCFYNNDPSYEALYGRLYTLQSAQNNTPAGWRLPTDDDWTALADFYGANAYNELIAGGSSGLNLQLGGENYLDVGCDNIGSSGIYWGLSTEGPGLEGVAIITAGQVACLDVPAEPGYTGSCSLRFILSSATSTISESVRTEELPDAFQEQQLNPGLKK
ncbi:MAG TPA: FISUMP domain-containing protein, partial [Bacteroidia bacterium]|nr:FISUMP domain-containing protein [Bacteroidia bacterium]